VRPNPSLERTATGLALGPLPGVVHHPSSGPSAIPASARSAQTLGLMQVPLTIIDSFEVTAELLHKLDGMALGKWYVLEGRFTSAAELPLPGSQVAIQEPAGSRRQAVVRSREVRHGTAAISFGAVDTSPIPRLSVIHPVGAP
jgi:hypothetical protein